MDIIYKGFDKRDMKRPMVLVEPGRYCVGNAGITLYTVGSYKYIRDIRDYISVDGGMTDNIRSSLYNAKYDAVIANNYNQLPKPAVVFTYQGKSKEVIRRQTFDDLVAYDVD